MQGSGEGLGRSDGLDTSVREAARVALREPVLLAGFPGLGYVGKITVTYMARQLGAKRLAELYSPYFPYHVITTRGGGIRLPRAQFRYYQNGNPSGNDLVFCTSDSQAQSLEGQFEVVEKILCYARGLGVRSVISVGGFSSRGGGGGAGAEPKAVCLGTGRRILDRVVSAGAEPSPLGNPIVGLAGVTSGMAKLMGLEAACILGETIGHLPDPGSAKRVVTVLQRLLGVSLDLEPLDKEILKAMSVFKRMEEVQKEMESLTKGSLEREARKMTYIS